jgi:hypothetical protein
MTFLKSKLRRETPVVADHHGRNIDARRTGVEDDDVRFKEKGRRFAVDGARKNSSQRCD